MTGVQTCALRSEEHTSELQSHDNLVCRLLLEKTSHVVEHPHGHVGGDYLIEHLRDRGGLGAAVGAGAEHVTEPEYLLFFLNDGATPEISPLPLPRPLPI